MYRGFCLFSFGASQQFPTSFRGFITYDFTFCLHLFLNQNALSLYIYFQLISVLQLCWFQEFSPAKCLNFVLLTCLFSIFPFHLSCQQTFSLFLILVNCSEKKQSQGNKNQTPISCQSAVWCQQQCKIPENRKTCSCLEQLKNPASFTSCPLGIFAVINSLCQSG